MDSFVFTCSEYIQIWTTGGHPTLSILIKEKGHCRFSCLHMCVWVHFHLCFHVKCCPVCYRGNLWLTEALLRDLQSPQIPVCGYVKESTSFLNALLKNLFFLLSFFLSLQQVFTKFQTCSVMCWPGVILITLKNNASIKLNFVIR